MNKVLVVVYSWTGTSRRLAESLAASQQWTLGEIQDADPGRGNWRCVLDSLLRRQPPIRYEGPDPRDFDTVVLIAPIWVYRLAGPMRSFVAQHKADLRETVLLSVMGNRGVPNALVEVTSLLGRPPLFTAAFTTREVEDGSYGGKLLALSQAIQQAHDSSSTVLRPANLSPQAD